MTEKKIKINCRLYFNELCPKDYLRCINASIYKTLTEYDQSLSRQLHDFKGKKPYRVLGLGDYIRSSYKKIKPAEISFKLELFDELMEFSEAFHEGLKFDFQQYRVEFFSHKTEEYQKDPDLREFKLSSPVICQGNFGNDPRIAILKSILNLPKDQLKARWIDFYDEFEREVTIQPGAKHLSYYGKIKCFSDIVQEQLDYGCFRGLGPKTTFGFGELIAR